MSYACCDMDYLKPFWGARPKFLREPRIYSGAESKARTIVAVRQIKLAITNAQLGILVVMHQDTSYSETCRKLLMCATDPAADNDEDDCNEEAIDTSSAAQNEIALGTDWLQCIPSCPDSNSALTPTTPKRQHGQLLLCIGTFSKYSSMCMNDSTMSTLDEANDPNNVIIITKSAIMLPLDYQEQIVHGAHAEEAVQAVAVALRDSKSSRLTWGHGPGTKSRLLSWAFSHLPYASRMNLVLELNTSRQSALLKPLSKSLHEMNSNKHTVFDMMASYIQFQNQMKLSMGPKGDAPLSTSLMLASMSA
ncbi:expressed unknown protein [Seminavis robusta]|uniref:Uncharacterized protein n=1 Tax=Seminavis robusta TaxID=568900 RepID=A0A9N8HFL3_9STRA|nr:expressed unknown protein [Seminavis robusta]|eukprot:Sro461_g147830.1 n/a (306) ;mRNA; r:51997-52914